MQTLGGDTIRLSVPVARDAAAANVSAAPGMAEDEVVIQKTRELAPPLFTRELEKRLLT